MSIKIQKCVGKVLLTNDLHAVCKMERFLKVDWSGKRREVDRLGEGERTRFFVNYG